MSALHSAEYKDDAGKITETDVLIEPQNIPKVQDTTVLLARHLGKKLDDRWRSSMLRISD